MHQAAHWNFSTYATTNDYATTKNTATHTTNITGGNLTKRNHAI